MLIEMVKGRAGENVDLADSAYLNVCDENHPTLAFDDKIMLNHAKDLRPASLFGSLSALFFCLRSPWLAHKAVAHLAAFMRGRGETAVPVSSNVH